VQVPTITANIEQYVDNDQDFSLRGTRNCDVQDLRAVRGLRC
jgi:hypothetical protein